MTKYIIALIVLIAAGGIFLYATQTAQAPTQPLQEAENPFGDGSTKVGTVENIPSYSDADKDGMPSGSDKTTPTAPATTGANTGDDSTGAAGGATTQAAEPGVISRSELAKHNTQADCWIGYKGTVYDITNWLPRHPGSAGAIAPFCGTADEFAAAFNKQHGTSREARLQKEGVKEGALGN